MTKEGQMHVHVPQTGEEVLATRIDCARLSERESWGQP